jgi:hypothetical protein
MNRTIRLAACLAAVVLALPSVAQANGRHGGQVVVSSGWRGGGHWHGGHRHHHHHRHWAWGVGIGIGLGVPLYRSYAYDPYYYGAPVVVAPPGVVYATEPAPVPMVAPMAQPEPIIYPRNGQNAAQLETDRRECNRWAIGQPSAMADAHVFHRATLACMEGRGYTVR